MALPTSGLKAVTPIAVARMRIAAVSRRLHLENGRSGVVAQSTMTGAMTKIPVASANHQLAQVTSLSKLASLVKNSPTETMPELIIAVGTKETSAKLATPRGVSKVLRPFDQRSMSHAPASAASSVPAPTKPEAKNERAAISLEKKDPNKIAGQIR